MTDAGEQNIDWIPDKDWVTLERHAIYQASEQKLTADVPKIWQVGFIPSFVKQHMKISLFPCCLNYVNVYIVLFKPSWIINLKLKLYVAMNVLFIILYDIGFYRYIASNSIKVFVI